MSSGEFIQFAPPSFQRPGLESIVYGETRRSGANPLAGNLGETAAVIGRENYRTLGAVLPFEKWEKHERGAVLERAEHIKTASQLSELALLRVGHGVGVVSASTWMEDMSYTTPYNERIIADSSFVTREGDGVGVAIGDCTSVVIAQPGERFAGIIHSGFRGMLNETIPIAVQAYEHEGLDAKKLVAHVGPHARHFQLDRDEASEAAELLRTASNDVRQEYKAFTHPGMEWKNPVFDMTRYALRQLVRAGIQPANISVSPIDTTTDSTVFSHYNATTMNTLNGRVGIITGIKQA